MILSSPFLALARIFSVPKHPFSMKQPQSKESRYKQIAAAILKAYEANGYRLDKTQVEMAAEFGVTRITIRRALDWLEMEGKLSRLSGRSYLPSVTKARKKVIGFPIWSDSLLSVEVPMIEQRLTMARSAHLELAQLGHRLDIQCVGHWRRPDLQKIATLCQQWDGLILEPRENEKQIGEDHPFAPLLERTAIFGTLQGQRFNCVAPDHYGAVQLAVEECARLGARRILYTGRREETIPHLFVRLASAEIAVSRHRQMELLFADGGMHSGETFGAVKRFLAEGGQCDMILAGSTYATLGALRALIELRIPVPDQIGLIGIGMSSFMPYLSPRPTVIAPERQELGWAVAKMASLLSNPGAKPIPNVLVPAQLFVGETTSRHDARNPQPSLSAFGEKESVDVGGWKGG